MLFAICGLATLSGSIYVGYLVLDEFQKMLESHDAAWAEIGQVILTLAVLGCASVTALHSIAHVWM